MKSMLSFILNFPYQSYKHKPLFKICSKRANVPKVCLQGLVSRLLDKFLALSLDTRRAHLTAQ